MWPKVAFGFFWLDWEPLFLWENVPSLLLFSFLNQPSPQGFLCSVPGGFFLFIYLNFYLFIFGWLGLHCGAWASHWGDFSCVSTGLAALLHVGSYQARDWTHVPCNGRLILNLWTTSKVIQILNNWSTKKVLKHNLLYASQELLRYINLCTMSYVVMEIFSQI